MRCLTHRKILPWLTTQSASLPPLQAFSFSSSFSDDSINSDQKQPPLTVCILGPPNAGKSTLFNRLLDKDRLYRLNVASKGYKHKRGRAIVHDTAGTTRDRRLADATLAGIPLSIWDTAGILERDDNQMQQRQQQYTKQQNHHHHSATDSTSSIDTTMQLSHTQQAAAVSDVIWLVVDGRLYGGGVPPDVVRTARWLRRLPPLRRNGKQQERTIQVIANKLLEQHGAEDNDQEEAQREFMDALEHELGFGPAIPISALQGYGLADLAVTLQSLRETGDESEEEEEGDDDEKEHPLQLVIMGRQNVGKSTLLNALTRSDRSLTGPLAGLTRDAVVVDLPSTDSTTAVTNDDGAPGLRLVDTAGMTKPRADDSLHQLALQDAIHRMQVADVVILVLEATAGIVQQTELRLAHQILTEGRALVIVVNKLDCITTFGVNYRHVDLIQQVRDQLEERYAALRNTPILAVSAATGRNVSRVLPVVYEAQKRWNRVISTAKLNQWCRDLQDRTATTHTRIRIKYMLQTKGRPPTFVLFCNTTKVPENVSNHWKRKLQDAFGFYGMDVRLQIRQSVNPFVTSKKQRRGGFGLGGHEARKQRKLKELADTYRGCATKEEGRAKMLAATRKKHRRKKKKRQ